MTEDAARPAVESGRTAEERARRAERMAAVLEQRTEDPDELLEPEDIDASVVDVQL